MSTQDCAHVRTLFTFWTAIFVKYDILIEYLNVSIQKSSKDAKLGQCLYYRPIAKPENVGFYRTSTIVEKMWFSKTFWNSQTEILQVVLFKSWELQQFIFLWILHYLEIMLNGRSSKPEVTSVVT
jgi:hypothetical protein